MMFFHCCWKPAIKAVGQIREDSTPKTKRDKNERNFSPLRRKRALKLVFIDGIQSKERRYANSIF